MISKKPETMGTVHSRILYHTDGKIYRWCKVLKNQSLEFGIEKPRDQGGIELSYWCYNNEVHEYDHPVTEEYWKCVKEYLKKLKESEHVSFYSQIHTLCDQYLPEDIVNIIFN